ASLVLLQNDDDLFVCETVALHSLVLSMGQSLLQNGLFQRGKVNGSKAEEGFPRCLVLDTMLSTAGASVPGKVRDL
ncbi:hypothetical protein, partial [Ensifer sp. ENS01]|uniref:hypothetical protein n=1 Tax=Ensifer sp. ENS01 TaxID=2769293 RepID=UPI0017855EC4